ncbi:MULTISPECIES: hypothetical protein [Rhodococcus erythropolis group]|uniref:Uncharacterized protein n=1 Tax=Rhodococcus erythropolis TaxID=1833 RepID=A0A8I0ZUY6_RHOER|nr:MULTISPECIES: hypothetical protein [Rhodococcus erythropolis group]MBH5143708.1 hypothetical protein [Rhodococcus erythropolis]MBO8150463.1 hypothetical protein [Rhodococcus erythropolis]MDO1492661.1 hypothetical protein [Rhodococcus erythropolis]MYV31916.1 hypothetical protein [Rhodococcus erythropolis]
MVETKHTSEATEAAPSSTVIYADSAKVAMIAREEAQRWGQLLDRLAK